MIEDVVRFLVVLLVVVEPVSLAPLFATITEGDTHQARRHTAIKATLIAGTMLALTAVGGAPLLAVLGISIDAFRIFGGLMLFLIAMDMVYVRQTAVRGPTGTEQDEARHRSDVSVFPLAFPFIAGPGALATILLAFGGQDLGAGRYGAYLVVIVVVMLITLTFMLLSSPFMRLLGVTGANVVSRLTGVILGALAVQFVLDGIRGAVSP